MESGDDKGYVNQIKCVELYICNICVYYIYHVFCTVVHYLSKSTKLLLNTFRRNVGWPGICQPTNFCYFKL